MAITLNTVNFRLGYIIDPQSVRTAVNSFDKIERKAKQTKNNDLKMNVDIKTSKAEGSISKLRESVKKLSNDIKNVGDVNISANGLKGDGGGSGVVKTALGVAGAVSTLGIKKRYDNLNFARKELKELDGSQALRDLGAYTVAQNMQGVVNDELLGALENVYSNLEGLNWVNMERDSKGKLQGYGAEIFKNKEFKPLQDALRAYNDPKSKFQGDRMVILSALARMAQIEQTGGLSKGSQALLGNIFAERSIAGSGAIDFFRYQEGLTPTSMKSVRDNLAQYMISGQIEGSKEIENAMKNAQQLNEVIQKLTKGLSKLGDVVLSVATPFESLKKGFKSLFEGNQLTPPPVQPNQRLLRFGITRGQDERIERE